jgi:serine/threonine protein kinase
LGVGRYTLVDELGRGGMGVVWLAEDQKIGRRVAIKELLLPPGIPPGERRVFEERVLREARIAGRLSDPGIVTVHDVLQEDGATYIVMELIEAPTLAEVVQRRGPLPADQVLKIAEQVLLALQTAHAAGVVHRDVKPGNVMVGANGRVKLTDFGIAQSTEDSRLTTSGTLVGSPTYISPERLLGNEATPASDLWSLGATLFFAVEGVGPYDRASTVASIQAILNERAQLRVAPPGPVADLVNGLLDPAPATRLTAGQAHQLIDHARNHRPSTGPQQVLPHPQPGPQPSSGPQPVIQYPLSGPQTVVHHSPPPGHGTQVMPTQRTGKKAVLIGAAVVVVAGVVAVILAVSGVFSPPANNNTASGGPSTKSSSGSAPKSEDSNSGSDGTNPKVDNAEPRTYGPDGYVTADEFVEAAGLGCYAGDDVSSLEAIDCAQAHSVEVFAQVDLGSDGDGYPETSAMSRVAKESCREKSQALKPEVEITVAALMPTEGAWKQDKQDVLCIAGRTDGDDMTGTLAGG